MQRSLRTRLTFLFLVIAIFPLLIVGIIITQQSFSAQTEQAINNQNEVALRVAASVSEYILAPEREMSALLRVRNIQKLERTEIKTIFTDLLSFSDIYNHLSMTDRFGNEISSVGRLEIIFSGEQLGSRRGHPEFEVPMETGKTYYGPIYFDDETGEPFMTVSLPIIDLTTGNATGVLIAELRFKTVWRLMSDASKNGQSVYLVDKNNYVVAHSNPSVVLQQNTFEHPAQSSAATGLDGGQAILGIAPVDANGEDLFQVVAELPTELALALSYQLIYTTILILIFTILAILGYSIRETGQITHPLEELADAANELTQGNLNVRVKVRTLDEIGTLGKTFNLMTSQLYDTLSSLEQRVADRTQELEQQSEELSKRSAELETLNENNRKRANQFETIGLVMRSVASIKNLDELLQQITALISERFEFYHVGIFLIDEAKEYAVLSAANSEGGQRMLARGHRLRIGQVGIVGHVTRNGTPRIALDVGDDAVFFNNPDLPNTRSEMALPLQDGMAIIGALDVQSIEPNAFSPEDIRVLGTLADQVSIAIQNARLFESTQRALADAEIVYKRDLREQWRNITHGTVTGYTYNLTGSRPLEENLSSTAAIQALESGETQVSNEADTSTLAIPVTLRGETIGVLNIRAADKKTWTQNELDIVQAVADRVAISAESTRLLEDSQQRAIIEQTIGEITAKIGASINIRNVLQTAVEEMGRILPGSEVVIQFQSPEDQE